MRTWMYLQNPFLNATASSYLNGMNISTYHDNALAKMKSDPFILGLYNAYHPLHLLYKTAYSTWITQGGTQQGETLNLQQLLNWLSNTKIRHWDQQILSHYEPNTPAYKRLLPNHRKPFQQGSQIERILAVKSLSDAIGSDELLAATKTDILNCYTQLDAAYDMQKGNKTSTKNLSGNLELAREAMCAGQYANLGGLIQKYSTTPTVIEQYFDLQAIRRSQQVFFTGQLKPGEVYTIVKHTFGETDQVLLTNTGTTQLKFYLAHAKDAQPGDTFITLATGEQTVMAGALGKLTDMYLTVVNTDPLHAGEFSAELV